MKHSKGTGNTHNTGGKGNIDEGGNVTTRIPYTDSISVPAPEGTTKKRGKNKGK
ncbi:MAG TPA: hypothetical protein PLL98_03040 [Bacillota bacterium]|nr:hypothetical protein [Bacillota bacterium]HOR85442.1 hypothetical protein [Bacillota bacterium]HPL52834.1 hypothetical protein [Bacillota bacterium]